MTNPAYSSYPYIYSNKGLAQRYAIDRLGQNQYWNTANSESRQENSIASRLGRHAVTQNGTNNVPLPGAVYKFAVLQGLGTADFRYAGAGAAIYRRSGETDGAFTQLVGYAPLSGQRFSASAYRPSNTSYPYIFFGDANAMLKDNGTLNPLQIWGIFAPTIPPTLEVLQYAIAVINNFQSSTGITFTNVGSPAFGNKSLGSTLGTPILSAPGLFLVSPLPTLIGIVSQSLIAVGTENNISVLSTTGTAFKAQFQNNHASTDPIVNGEVQGTINASTVGIVQKITSLDLGQIGGNITGNSDIINIGIQATPTANIASVSVVFDVADGSFTQAYYEYDFTSAQITQLAIFNGASMPIGSFTTFGEAGNEGHTWSNVAAWKIIITTNAGSGGISFTIGDFYLYGGYGPDVTGGVPYDYRYTYYNINTGDESGPSVVLVPGSFVSPVSQPVSISFTPSPDSQVTHVRIYRRGGTLPNQWLQVAQVPIGTTSFIDTLSDGQISSNNILNVDTAPPVTSTLVAPVNTTLSASVSVGSTIVQVANIANIFPNQVVTIDALTSNEETVIIRSISPVLSSIGAYFQLPHSSGATVQATTRTGTPVSIGTIAFDRAWLAGDPDNPNVLYYSDRFNPESFPLENTLDIGNPSDPIMGIVEWNGQLYVFTQTTIWNILGANTGTSVPLPYKTAAHHGLYAVDGWTETDGELWFVSEGGIYAFQGATDVYVSEQIEWIFTAQLISDTQPRAVVLMDPNKIGDCTMEYYQNEVYVCYTGLDGLRHRVIYSKVYKRWRNDDQPANCILLEDDTYKLMFGDVNGMIYQDRTGNFDDAGFSAGVQQFSPIPFNLQTAALDMGMPKNFKNFNELTLDIDTGGLPVTITLLFDYGLTYVPIGTVTTTGRQQVDFKINAGDGQLSLNVSLRLTASIASAVVNPITCYEAHIRATPEAELRQSYDSYLEDYGSPDWKIVKQVYVQYLAPDPAGITFNVFIGGGSTPRYSFNLPQALTRTSWRVRLPAAKGKIWRWVATSASDFRLYSDSRVEYKRVTQDLGYTTQPFQQQTPQQP